MKIAFVSNFYNHHQKYLSDELYRLTGGNFSFIATEPINEKRLKMGWGTEKAPDYVHISYINEETKQKCQKIIDEADVVIHGSAPYALLTNRLKQGRLTFKYSERPYKTPCPLYKRPIHFLRNFKKIIRYNNFYILCASAYTSADYAKVLTFKNKAYKWGYFTQLKEYDDIQALIENKKKNSILWCSRFISLKHPEAPLLIAKRLKEAGYDFELNMIGNGTLLETVKERVQKNGLSECVHFLGTMTPEEVRNYMEQSEIFLFTSDKNEGWGAVLNESMNSACATVASHAIGSVPFLLENEENGFIYKDGDMDDLYNKVKFLLDNSEKRVEISKKAYKTIFEEWNAKNAAKKFIELTEKLLGTERKGFSFDKGVCSKAEILKDDWLN